jgi:ribonuclease III
MKDISKLFQILQVPVPQDMYQLGIFWQALTHKSYGVDDLTDVPDYDRLEFLGDSILKFTINEYLFSIFNKYDSGQLTKLSAYLLSDKSLLRIANELHIVRFVRTGIRIKPQAVLSDVMESLFGACYLVYGLKSTKELILRLYKDLILEGDSSELKDNYKAALQELTQSKQLGLPDYVVVKTDGPPHSPNFEVEIRLAGKVLGRGSGPSKKEAGQMAAKDSLDFLFVNKDFPN